MKYMNEHDIERAEMLFRSGPPSEHHPVLGPAVLTLRSLMAGANGCSDGWASWPKPARAARQLMELLEPTGSILINDRIRPDATPARLQAAYTQLRRFRTQHPACKFRIYPAEGVTNADPRASELPQSRFTVEIVITAAGTLKHLRVLDGTLPEGTFRGVVEVADDDDR